MTESDRIIWMLRLCNYCTKNLAYFRAGRINDMAIFPPTDLHITINGNFIDVCVLDWCKLFGAEKNQQHHWTKAFADRENFMRRLLEAIGCAENQYEVHRQQMLSYRDQFVARLDCRPKFTVPTLDVAKSSVFFLYSSLRCTYPELSRALGEPKTLDDRYKAWSAEAYEFYRFLADAAASHHH
jgi:hypothetical protein